MCRVNTRDESNSWCAEYDTERELFNSALFNRFPCSSLRDESVRERGESGGKLRGKGAGGNSEVESKVSGEGGSCVRTCAIGKTVKSEAKRS